MKVTVFVFINEFKAVVVVKNNNIWPDPNIWFMGCVRTKQQVATEDSDKVKTISENECTSQSCSKI